MLGAELALIIALAQQPRQVTLVFAEHRETISLVDAQQEFRRLDSIVRSDEQEKRHAALVVALGTVRQDVVQCHNGVRENWVGELFVCGN